MNLLPGNGPYRIFVPATLLFLVGALGLIVAFRPALRVVRSSIVLLRTTPSPGEYLDLLAYSVGYAALAMILFAICLVTAIGLFKGWRWSWWIGVAFFVGGVGGALSYPSTNLRYLMSAAAAIAAHGIVLLTPAAFGYYAVSSTFHSRRALLSSVLGFIIVAATTWHIPTLHRETTATAERWQAKYQQTGPAPDSGTTLRTPQVP